MKTPHPYKQKILAEGIILREFSAKTDSEELVWHQDKLDRSVKVISAGGWMLQLEEGLPFPLVDGVIYKIPAKSWHRVIRGNRDLKIEIMES